MPKIIYKPPVSQQGKDFGTREKSQRARKGVKKFGTDRIVPKFQNSKIKMREEKVNVDDNFEISFENAIEAKPAKQEPKDFLGENKDSGDVEDELMELTSAEEVGITLELEMSKVFETKDGIHDCTKCEKHFPSLRALYAHMKNVHEEVSVDVRFGCEMCDKTFRYEKKLCTHYAKAHAEEAKYHCQTCPKSFTKVRDFRHHMKTHDQTEKIRYNCPQCEKSFTSKQYLRHHVLVVHEGVRLSFKCDQCDKSYGRSYDLKRHQKWKHQGQRYQCTKCEKDYARKELLRDHVQSVHEGMDLSVACDECDKICTSVSNLSDHKRLVHKGIRVTCNDCGKKYKNKQHLKEHQDTVHLGVRHKCQVCSKVYKTLKSFQLHSQKCESHDENRFDCTQCEKSFSSKYYLKRHVLSFCEKSKDGLEIMKKE